MFVQFMRIFSTSLSGAVLLTALSTQLSAQSSYSVTKLDSDIPSLAAHTDPNLVNPWGLAAFPNAPWWVSDNGTGLSTLYDASGNIQSLVVVIPPSSSNPGATGTPTGIVANTTSGFRSAAFIFCTEDGTISTWTGGNLANIVVDKGSAAVYKGMTLGTMNSNPVLYVANFKGAAVEVYDTGFNPVTLASGAFVDPHVPAGYGPFNVQVLNGNVFVTFAEQDAEKHDEVDGPGLGYVDEFDSNGNLVMRFGHGDFLNAPWGLAIAPSTFGAFANDLIVGQFGNGTMVAFDPGTGRAVGALYNSASGRPITAAGLWALVFGLGGSAGSPDTLFFTAGGKDEGHGVLGSIVPAQ